MSYIALYREWRPTRFGDMVEQQHVVKTLRYSVSSGRIAHAYLFCGTRGTGKTTMAQILSRAVNCLNPQEGEPCNQCEVCREILSGGSVDVLEIDAASNNSVDNVRSIRDEVIYTPTKARRKVYIIDEVHMLSSGAFNALLKTLEEPPEHAIFILATTEPHKLPATILSRCQRFDFRRISSGSIVEQLNKIARAEGITLGADAANMIARLSDGAMRDAISLLDQCISVGGKRIEYDDVLAVVGIVNDAFITGFTTDILKRNIPAILENIGRLIADGRDVAFFVSNLVLYFRNLLICKSTKGQCDNLLEVTTDVLATIRKQAGKLSQGEIIRYLKELSSLEYNLKWASNKRVLLEVTLIKLCDSVYTGSDIEDRLAILEEKLASGDFNTRPAPASQSDMTAAPDFTPAAGNARDLDAAAPDERPSPAESAEYTHWPAIMKYLKDMGRMTIYSYLINVKAIKPDEDTIALIIKEAPLRANISRPEYLKIIGEAAQKVTGREMKIKYLDEDIFVKASPKAKPAESELIRKAQDIADKAGLPLEIIDE